MGGPFDYLPSSPAQVPESVMPPQDYSRERVPRLSSLRVAKGSLGHIEPGL